MKIPAMVSACLCAVLAAVVPVTARAAEQVVETLDDWEALRTAADKQDPQCVLRRIYQEPGEKERSWIVMGRDEQGVAVSLGYGSWDFGSDHPRYIVLLLNNRIVDKRSRWSADGKVLTSAIPNALVPSLLATDALVLRFKEGDVTFRTPRLPDAFAMLERCEQPPAPTQARIEAFAAGVTLQQALTTCDVPLTKRQRTELDAKVADLQPEMRAIEAELRAELAKGGSTPSCADLMKPTFSAKLDTYLKLSPEAFSAEMEREKTEQAAKAKAAAEQAETEKRAAEARAAEERAASERRAAEARAAEAAAIADKANAEQAVANAKIAAEKAIAEARAAEAKATAERVAAEKMAAEAKADAERATADAQAARARADAEKAATEKAAADAKVASEKVAGDKAAGDKPAEPKASQAAPPAETAPSTPNATNGQP